MEQDDITFDGQKLTDSFRRQLKNWLWKGPILLLLLLFAALLLIPISYTATVSIAMQQPAQGGSALAMLTSGGQNKRYMGILKSREMAEVVERHTQLRQFYSLKSEDDAVMLLMKNIKLDDNATDGLLYVNVTLPGPPKLRVLRSPSPFQVKNKAAQAANLYALALKEYYITSDTDQGSALLRGADQEVRQARAAYDNSVVQVLAFSRGLRHVDPRSLPTSASETADTATVASGLGSLYTSLAQVQAELKSALAARQTQEAMTREQLQNLNKVPADDPLLGVIRNRVKQDQANYETYQNLYGPENPRVIDARTRLEVDQAELSRQIQGVKQNLTTPNIRSDQQIQGLYARQAVLLRQVADAERRMGVHRELSGQLTRLQTEVVLRLEYLKAALTEAAKIRLENVSAQSRMSIVDYAIPPKTGSPSGAILAAVCVLLVALSFLISVARDYFRSAPGTPIEPLPAKSFNGSGAKPAEKPQEETARETTLPPARRP